MNSRPRLELVRSGPDPAPLRELYERYGASVYGRCTYLLRDRSKAEDAVQDVFAKALEHWDGFRAEASPLTWLIKIATHHCLNVIRGERAAWRGRYERDARAHHEATGGGHGGAGMHEDRDLVRRMLERVDEETQAAVIHYHVDEMTLEEVAAAIGRSIPTVRKRLDEFAAICGKEVVP
jgi:RNA polymerase sigma-70 factor (ECF subfamily)